jgi:hypothetical protein
MQGDRGLANVFYVTNTVRIFVRIFALHKFLMKIIEIIDKILKHEKHDNEIHTLTQ